MHTSYFCEFTAHDLGWQVDVKLNKELVHFRLGYMLREQSMYVNGAHQRQRAVVIDISLLKRLAQPSIASAVSRVRVRQ